MVEFGKRILFVGYGAVAQCTLPILMKHMKVSPKNVTVMDFEDRRASLAPWIKKGVQFVQKKITRANMKAVLGKHVGEGDVIVDLAWNIDACEILQWCHDHGVLYVNTSVEVWDPYEGAENKHPTERTLYWRHMNLRKMTAGWKEKGPTAVLEHGANPGLISHFTKQGLLDIGKKMLKDGKAKGRDAEEIQQLMKDQAWNRLARKLGVKVIHCSERDTQITNVPKKVDEFVNTWSIEGFREEGTTTAEMGWGTHEKELPPYAVEHESGPRNQNLPLAHGDEHLGGLLGPQLLHPRHGGAARRGVLDQRQAHRVGGRQGGLPAHRPLRVLPERLGHRVAERAARVRLQAPAEPPHPERRDHQRLRHPGRPHHGPPLQLLVGRQRPLHRGVAAPGPAPERHHHAGGHLGGRRTSSGW